MKIYLPIALLLTFFLCTNLAFNKPKRQPNLNAQIGRLLFFDTRLSINQTTSCASCHIPELAFTDSFVTPKGALGDIVIRNTPTIINLADNETFNWADERIVTLQQQSDIPLFGKHPIEMGNDSLNIKSLQFIFNDEKYLPLLQKKKMSTINWTMVKNFIAEFVSLFRFDNSKYDLWKKGKRTLSKDEIAGKNLFFSDRLNCKKCHGGNDFDEPEFSRMNHYQNIGLYNIGKDSLYANGDNGLHNTTKDKDDIGKFKIPTLRNIAITSPYFHDGSVASLNEVIDHYARGGRLTNKGLNAGDGKLHPNKNQFIEGFTITAKEKKQLISFLQTLTDTSYLSNTFYTTPFSKKKYY
jgi:cytochrome c peroxidase